MNPTGDEILRAIEEPPYERVAREIRETARKRLHEDKSGYPRWAWPAVDRATGPLAPGEVWTLGALQGNGKTAWLLNVIDSLTAEKIPWLYLGLEVDATTLMLWWAAMRQGIPRFRLVDNTLTPAETDAMQGEVNALMQFTGDTNFVPSHDVNPRQVVKLMESAVAANSGRVVIVDHLHHLNFGETANLRAAVSDAMRRIKACAITTGQTVILAAQLARRSGDVLQPWRTPSTGELKESGAIEQISDVVLFLHRMMRPGSKDAQRLYTLGEAPASAFAWPNRIGFTVAKHRLGKPAHVTIPLEIQAPTDRIYEAPPERPDWRATTP
jgi:replicative DNA helicase